MSSLQRPLFSLPPVRTLILLGLMAASLPAQAQNYAVTLDGVDDYIRFPTLSRQLAGTNGSTLEGWFFVDHDQSTDAALFGTNNADKSNLYHLFYYPTTRQFGVYTGAHFKTDRIDFETGRWYHLALARDADDNITLYVDGEIELELTTTVSLPSTTGWFSVGQEWDGDNTSDHLHGKVDDVRAWSRVRTQAEIRGRAYEELQGTEEDLLGYWRMDGNTRDPNSAHQGYAEGFSYADNLTTENAAFPVLRSASPVTGATLVDRQSSLRLSFENPMQAGTGEVRLYGPNGLEETIEAQSSSVQISGTEVTISPQVALTAGASYYVQIDDGALESKWGEAWAGYSGTSDWTFTTGSGGAALEFDGQTGSLVEEHLEVADAVALGDEYTIEAWIRSENTSGTSTVFALASGTGTHHHVLLQHLSSGSFTFRHSQASPAFTRSRADVPHSEWHHIAAVKSSTQLLLYVDGVLADSDDDATPVDNDAVEVMIAYSKQADRFQGQMDELRLWGTARTEAEINATMLTELTGAESGLLSYWPLDEGTGSAAYDVAGGRDATLVNMEESDWVADYNPILAALSPADNSTGVLTSSTLVLTFDRNVTAGTGDVRIVAASGATQTIAITSSEVAFSGATVTISPTGGLDPATAYHVEIDQGAIRGLWSGITNGSTWNFTTDDTPALASLSPADNDILGLRPLLQMTFDQDVLLGSGNVVVSQGGSAVHTLSVASSAVELDGRVVTIMLPEALEPLTEYSVQVEANAVTGVLGTGWGGISDETSWTFTTRSAISPLAGRGLQFDSPTQVDFPGTDLIDADEGAFEMWFLAQHLSGEKVLLHGGESNANGAGPQDEFYLFLNGTKLSLRYYDGGSLQFALLGTTTLETSQPYHAAVSWSKTLGTLEVYLNGELEMSTSFSGLNKEAWDDHIRLGRPNGSPTRVLLGRIDEVRFFNAARSAEDIFLTMRTALSGSEEGLIGYYQFEAGSGTTVYDLIGGRDGTVSNSRASWPSSPAPFGESYTQDEAAGTLTFGTTGVQITYLSQSGAPTQVIRMDQAPNVTPAGFSGDDLMDDQYWFINRYGNSLFNATITFTVAEDLLAADEGVPEQIKLYSRPTDSYTDDWVLVASASRVNAALNTATFRGIRGYSQFIIVRGDVLSGQLAASDNVYEDKVELTWDELPSQAAILQITRDGEPVSVLASDAQQYEDFDGTPGVTHTYCLIVKDSDGTEIDSLCDEGRRDFDSPTNISATDLTLADRVEVSWYDNSIIEAGYNLTYGNLLSLNGTDEYLDAGTLLNNLSTEYTLEGWFKPEAGTGAVSLFGVNTASGGNRILIFYYEGDDQFGHIESGHTRSEADYPAGQWYHVAVTVNASRHATLYINGEVAVEVDRSTDLSPTDRFSIGQEFDSARASNFFQGGVDEVRIWDTVRTEEEIQAAMNSVLVGDEDGLVAYWPMNGELTDVTGDHEAVMMPSGRTATWTDRDRPIKTESNVSFFSDFLGPQGETTTYCVQAFDENGHTSAEVCDEGTRGFVFPPTSVSASDGQYPDKVVVEWSDPTSDEDGFNVYGPGPETALAFDGSNDYVRIDGLTGDLGTAHTIELWVKPDPSITNATTCPITINSDTVLTGYAFCYKVQDQFQSVPGFPTDRWYHLAMVQDGSSLTYYVNGTAISSSVTEQPTASAWIQLGSSTWTSGEPRWIFRGEIGELRVWNTALDSEGIIAGIHSDLSGSEANLLAQFKMDEGSGTTVSSSVGSYQGTLYDGWNTEGNGPSWIDKANLITQTGPDVTSLDAPPLGPGVASPYCVATVSGTTESLAICDEGGIEILPPPTELTASLDTFDDKVELAWTDPGNTEDAFRIYRDGIALFTTGSGSETYTDNEATGGQDHEYCVVAVAFTDMDGDGQDDQEVESESVCATGRESLVLAPTSVSATAGDHEDQVLLTWKNPSTTAVLMKIFRDDVLVKTTVATRTSYSDKEVESGVSYTYCLAAVTSAGVESERSEDNEDEVCSTGSRALAPPLGVDATDDEEEDQVAITWEDHSSYEDGFYIYRDDELIGTLGKNQLSFLDMKGVPGTTYTYGVRAFDAFGVSEMTTNSGSRTLTAPSQVAATDAEYESRIVVTWADNSSAETGFRIYRREDGASDSTVVGTTAARVTSFTDSDGLTFGATYHYSVVAFDDYGQSASDSDPGETHILHPLSVNASSSYEDRVKLVWLDRSEVETGYRIYRGSSLETVTELDTAPADAQVYEDLTAVKGSSYTYCVTVYSGSLESDCEDAYTTGIRPTDPVVLPSYSDRIVREESVHIAWTGNPAGILFGYAVDVYGDYMISGAIGTDHPELAYIYYRDPSEGWILQAEIEGDPFKTAEYFGSHVAISDQYAMVSSRVYAGLAANPGKVRVYERSGTDWSLSQEIAPGNDGYTHHEFGRALAISGDYLFIGANEAYGVEDVGGVFVFKRNDDGTWDLVQSIPHPESTASTSEFGQHLAVDGDWLMVAGIDLAQEEDYSVYFLKLNPASERWELAQTIASAVNIEEVDLSGDVAIVGSEDFGVAITYELGSDGLWKETQELSPPDSDSGIRFGRSVSLSGFLALVGAPFATVSELGDAGAAYLYQFNGTEWEFVNRIVEDPAAQEAGASLGASVAVYGTTAVVGSPYSDAVIDGEEIANQGSVLVQEVEVDLLARAKDVSASDGSFNGRIQIVWDDDSFNEDGFYVFRNGSLIAETAPNVQSYADFEAAPGLPYEYCIQAFSLTTTSAAKVCDGGWRPFNGVISGQISTDDGAGTSEVAVCLDPSPNSALLLDGALGYAVAADLSFGGLASLDALSVEFWVQTTATGDATLLSYATAEESNLLVISSPDNLKLVLNNSPFELDLDVNDGAWHHVALTWDTAGELNAYLDGTLRTTIAGVEAGLEIASGGTLVLGQEQDSVGGGFDADEAFQGQMDELRLRSEVLTAASIAAYYLQPLVPDASGVIGYWPLDQYIRFTPENSGLADHLNLEDGAYISADGAPLNVCAESDDNGNYTLAGIPYGEEASFAVSPSREGRSFSPAARDVTLSTDTPVQNQVDFADVSAFGVSGTVVYDGTICPVEDLEIYVDGENATQTERDGLFSLSLTPEATAYQIAPFLDGHTFSPAFAEIIVDGEKSGVDFLETTTRSLDLYAGGGCSISVGDVWVKVSTPNGCFEKTYQIPNGAAELQLDLPPQSYYVEVVDVRLPEGSALDRVDVLDYYAAIGRQEVDLSESDTTIAFTYQAPLIISATGFPEYDENEGAEGLQYCAAPERLDVPILQQGVLYPLSIEVFEDYGTDLGTCPVEDVRIHVYDEIADNATAPLDTTLTGNLLQYYTVPTSANLLSGRFVDGVDRSHQKQIFITAESGERTQDANLWALVEGSRVREGNFATVPTAEVPLFVLRDPPGDRSYSYMEQGTKFCHTLQEWGIVNDLEIETGTVWSAGVNYTNYVGTPFGGKITPAYGINDFGIGGVALDLTWERSGMNQICFEAGERFSTSADPQFVGDDADVFLGAGFNLVFAQTDVVSVGETCEIELSQSITAGFDSDDPFTTAYAYTAGHIRDNVIPDLETMLGNESQAKCVVIGQSPVYEDMVVLGETVRTISHYEPVERCFDNEELQGAIDNWQAQLDFNQSLKDNAESVTDNRSFSAGSDYQNVVRTDSVYYHDWSVRYYSDDQFRKVTGFKLGGLGLENTLKVTFSRETLALAPGIIGVTENDLDLVGEEELTNTREFGYVLSDDDLGDFFTLDVLHESAQTIDVLVPDGTTGPSGIGPLAALSKINGLAKAVPGFGAAVSLASGLYDLSRILDPEGTAGLDTRLQTKLRQPFGSPVFRLRAGTSSCPVQDGTIARDAAVISIDKALLQNLDPNTPAVFTLALGNNSESDETRRYVLRSVHASNPYGAIITVNGVSVHSGVVFELPPGQTIEATMTVTRGANRFRYDDLELILFPECPSVLPEIREKEAARISFSAQFDAVCSDIAFRSDEGQELRFDGSTTAHNTLSGVEVILQDFNLAVLDPGESAGDEDDIQLGSIGLEYRQAGRASWNLAYQVDRDVIIGASNLTNPDDISNYTSLWGGPNTGDGEYEFRAFTDCGSGKQTYSEIYSGVVDRTPPRLIGALEPADQILHLGDLIEFSLDEPVACASVVTSGTEQNVFLTAPDGDDADTERDHIAIESTCSDRRVVLTPTNGLGDYEGQELLVTLLGGDNAVTDLLGNPLAETEDGNEHEWRFSVSQRQFAFSPIRVEYDLGLGETQVVDTRLVNGRGLGVSFTTGELTLTNGSATRTLTPSVTSGAIAADDYADLTLTLPDDLPVGTWTGTLEADATEGGIAIGTALFQVTANVACVVPDWEVSESDFGYSMTVVGQLQINELWAPEGSRVGALVAGAPRGQALVGPNGTFELTVYSNLVGPEGIVFQVWDADSCIKYREVSPFSVSFTDQTVLGTATTPLSLVAPAENSGTTSIALADGWTWFSANPADGLTDALSASTSDIIKSQTQFSLYEDGFGWLGPLTQDDGSLDVDPRQAYLIRLETEQSITLSGTPLLANEPIDVVPGWNWIGYLPDQPIAINEALQSLNPSANDIIKSQYGFAQYVPNVGWLGSLNVLEPGLGYMMRLASAGTLLYPSGVTATPVARVRSAEPMEEIRTVAATDVPNRKVDREVESELSREPVLSTEDRERALAGEYATGAAGSCVNPADYPFTLSLVARVVLDGVDVAQDGYELHAVSLGDGDEGCRGEVELQRIPSLGEYRGFLTVYGATDGEAFILEVFQPESGNRWRASTGLNFQSNAVLGSVANPIVVEAALATDTEAAEELPDSFGLDANFPNPFARQTTIRYQLPEARDVRVVVYDLLGRRVVELVREHHEAGRYEVVFDAAALAPGMYAYRMEAGDYKQTRTMVLLR